jgi:cysteinyl-tRNA synthetase
MKIYNTLTRKKEIIKFPQKRKTKLFVCGPTVYDHSHIGHARTYLFFDAFVKYLRQKGIKIFYLQNITNIDDKIINRAREEKKEPLELAEFYEKEYLADMKSLKINSVDQYARATDFIPEIVSQVQRLQEKGYAYIIEDGIYYDIKKFKNYGKLSGRTILKIEDAVSRIDETKNKKNKADFCLWKFEKPGEPSWQTSLGKGRPGWHIEDTAITEKFFGPCYDFHGGGRDLIFPHHEAEIAQMEAISGKSPLARYWLHSGMLTVKGQKMSKSLGNFVTIKDFLKNYNQETLRLMVFQTLWRSPLNYSREKAEQAKASLQTINDFLKRLLLLKGKKAKSVKKIILKSEKEFFKNLEDDFNTPKALGVVFSLIRKINPLIEKGELNKEDIQRLVKFFKKINEIFEIIVFPSPKEELPAEIKKLAEKRLRYRQEKNWQKADEIRTQIEKLGFVVQDTLQGQRILKKEENR